jgi:hypothetical protein
MGSGEPLRPPGAVVTVGSPPPPLPSPFGTFLLGRAEMMDGPAAAWGGRRAGLDKVRKKLGSYFIVLYCWDCAWRC